MPDPIDRRSFLVRGAGATAGVALTGLAGGVLGGCGDEGGAPPQAAPPPPGGTDHGVLSYQLMWVRNSEFAGQYAADARGYYDGFRSVNLVGGGPDVAPDAMVQSGLALFGVSDPQLTAAANDRGADLVIVGAVFQKSPYAVCSLSTRPIPEPAALVGARIGVQPTNEAIWAAFLRVNRIDPDAVDTVPVSTDLQPLVDGRVDGWFAFSMNEPNTLRVRGLEPTVLLLADHGLPMTGQNHVVRRDTLATKREAVKAALLGDVRGWRAVLSDPRLGVDLTMNTFGRDLDLDPRKELLQVQEQARLITTPATAQHGILTMTGELQDQVRATIRATGLATPGPELFDLSLVEEVYAEHPGLVALAGG